LHWPSKPQ